MADQRGRRLDLGRASSAFSAAECALAPAPKGRISRCPFERRPQHGLEQAAVAAFRVIAAHSGRRSRRPPSAMPRRSRRIRSMIAGLHQRHPGRPVAALLARSLGPSAAARPAGATAGDASAATDAAIASHAILDSASTGRSSRRPTSAAIRRRNLRRRSAPGSASATAARMVGKFQKRHDTAPQ